MEQKFVLDWSILGEVFKDDKAKCAFLEVVKQTLDTEVVSVKLGVENQDFEAFGAFRHSFGPVLQQLGLNDLEQELSNVQPNEPWGDAARVVLADMSRLSKYLEGFIADFK